LHFINCVCKILILLNDENLNYRYIDRFSFLAEGNMMLRPGVEVVNVNEYAYAVNGWTLKIKKMVKIMLNINQTIH